MADKDGDYFSSALSFSAARFLNHSLEKLSARHDRGATPFRPACRRHRWPRSACSVTFRLYCRALCAGLQRMRHVLKRPSRRADQRYVLNSSLLATMTYSDHATLDVVFRNGTVYRYFAVLARVVEELRRRRRELGAESFSIGLAQK